MYVAYMLMFRMEVDISMNVCVYGILYVTRMSIRVSVTGRYIVITMLVLVLVQLVVVLSGTGRADVFRDAEEGRQPRARQRRIR